MKYMVVEHFRNRDPLPVYRRFRDRGRMAPEGVQYLSSWVDDKFERCFQLMETADRVLLDQWIANWSDIVDFEIYPVVTSTEAAEIIAPRL
jgi:Protein of unknown function (DUF3303)